MDKELLKKIRKLPVVVSLSDMSWNKTGAWSLQKPDFVTKYPPCQAACPAHVPVREVLAKVREEDFDGAAQLFLDAHPFPAITGRVCHHPCQDRCLRGDFDEVLEIRAVERLLENYVGIPPAVTELTSPERKHVAIAGSGPAGMSCSYFLRRHGYDVTVFESHSKPGGMLRKGIPPYRLPDSVLDHEISRLKEMGITFKTGVTVTKDFVEHELTGYDALFIGIGAHISKDLRLTGEKSNQILSGLEFLSDYERYKKVFRNKQVIVVGGGNTAMDAARTSLRLGADVTVVYRRTRSEMPAIPEEIDGAIEEGCEFRFLTSPVEIRGNDGRLDLYCVEMELGEPDESGRPRPMSLFESRCMRIVDFVITAVGEDPGLEDFGDLIALERNLIQVDESGRSNVPYIFAGGDAAGYPRTVVDALQSGKKAANSICRYLENIGQPEADDVQSMLETSDLNTHYFEHEDAVKIKTINAGKRTSSFAEIFKDLGRQDAVKEAGRCLSCGACAYCDNCVIFCPDSAIVHAESGYEVRDEYCKGCGICIKECPRGVLVWRSGT